MEPHTQNPMHTRIQPTNIHVCPLSLYYNQSRSPVPVPFDYIITKATCRNIVLWLYYNQSKYYGTKSRIKRVNILQANCCNIVR